jgi:HAD superfamily hydrolase (TIGR01450 family)
VLAGVRGVVFDNDGTLVHRSGGELHVVPGAQEALDTVRSSGLPFAVFTNGSHLPSTEFARELRIAGLPIEDWQVLTPPDSLQVYLERRPAARVSAFVPDAVADHLAAAGVELVDGDRDERADVVFVGFPDAFEFEQLERAARDLRAGARLLTGSYVASYAGAAGPILSRGAMVTAAIAKAGGVRPTVVGKPSRAAVQAVTRRLGVSAHELAVVGDDVFVDMALGRLGGSRTILVRTGTSRDVELGRIPGRLRPDAVIETVADLFDAL